MARSVFCDGETGFGPAAPAAIHRNYVCVAHFLEIVGGQGGAETAAAIEDEWGVVVRDRFFDVAGSRVSGASEGWGRLEGGASPAPTTANHEVSNH